MDMMTKFMSTYYLNSPCIGRGVGDRALRPVCEDQLEFAQFPRAATVLKKGSWLARGQRGAGAHLSVSVLINDKLFVLCRVSTVRWIGDAYPRPRLPTALIKAKWRAKRREKRLPRHPGECSRLSQCPLHRYSGLPSCSCVCCRIAEETTLQQLLVCSWLGHL